MTVPAPLDRVQAALAARFPWEDRMVPDLGRITLLCDLLGDPQKAYPSVHLTGTNGKTSTARMVDALLRSFGLRPGPLHEPAPRALTERICLDGVPSTRSASPRPSTSCSRTSSSSTPAATCR